MLFSKNNQAKIVAIGAALFTLSHPVGSHAQEDPSQISKLMDCLFSVQPLEAEYRDRLQISCLQISYDSCEIRGMNTSCFIRMQEGIEENTLEILVNIPDTVSLRTFQENFYQRKRNELMDEDPFDYCESVSGIEEIRCKLEISSSRILDALRLYRLSSIDKREK